MKDLETLIVMKNKIMEILTRKQKKQCLAIIVVIFIGSLFELLGVTAILPFVQGILNIQDLYSKWYVKPILAIITFNSDFQLIAFLGIAIILIYIIKNGYLLLANYIQTRFKLRLQKDLSVLMLRSYMRRPYSYFLNVNSGDILRGVNSDVYGVYAIIEYFFKVLTEGLTVLLIAIYLVYSDPVMAIGVIVIALGCLLVITLGLKKKMHFMGERQQEVLAKQNKYAYEAINGIKEITVMQRNEQFIRQYSDAYEWKRKTDVSFYFAQALPERLIETFSVGAIIGMVCVRLAMGVDVNVFVPQLASFAIAAFRILPSISRLTGYFSGMVFYRPTLYVAYDNIIAAREYESYLKEYAETHLDKEAQGNQKSQFESEIEIRNVLWKYETATEPVLRDLSLTIHKGESIGLIGESGAGKSTLVDVILGLFQPQQGSIYVDGIDVFAIKKTWAQLVGYVPQSIFLLDNTIRANIAFGLDVDEIDDQKVWNALKQAQLDGFIAGLPDGLDTMVGERGVKLSGGQRQRIAIARALYHDPEILVLDEATSALDNETEEAVMQAIDFLQGIKTMIIVAHRLTTISNCDKIYEICRGKAILRDKDDVLNVQINEGKTDDT